MKRFALCFAALAACVPSRTAVFGPVEKDVERRVGVRPTWSGDARVSAAVDALLAKPLDRDAAVRIAIATNRRLQAEYDQLGIAASEVAAATVLAPMRVDIEYKMSGESDALEVDVTQDILDLLQLSQRRGIARAELAAARARAVSATVDLVAHVEMAYFDAVAAMQEVELRQTAYDAASLSAEVATRMRAAGNISDLSLAREQTQRERARVDLARAQLAAETSRESLNELLGLSGKRTSWTVAGQLPALPPAAPTLDNLEQDAVAANLELSAIRSEAEAAAGRVGVARVRAWLPELGIGLSADHGSGVADNGWDYGPALSFGLPLFNQQQGPRARAHAQLARARNLASATGTEVRARARSIRQQVLEAHTEARHLFDVVLPLQQRVVDESLKQYNAMNVSTFELLIARRDLVEAGQQYIDASRRYWRAEAAARALSRGGLPTTDAQTSTEGSDSSRSESRP